MVPRSKISILAQMMRTSFQVHLIFASFLRRKTPCQQLTAFLQNNLRWGNLFVLLFLTFPLLMTNNIDILSSSSSLLVVAGGDLQKPAWFDRGRDCETSQPWFGQSWGGRIGEQWSLHIKIVFDISSLNHYWSRGQTSYPMRVQIISQQSLKVRAYKKGSYRAVARVEEGSDSSSGRERALWWSIDQICKRECNDFPSV